jgi:SAM-dependent methyltransferase
MAAMSDDDQAGPVPAGDSAAGATGTGDSATAVGGSVASGAAVGGSVASGAGDGGAGAGEYRLYADLAQWWPLISPPAEYTAEAAYLAALLRAAWAAGGPAPAPPGGRRTVLDLGSGGGHNAVHLKAHADLTLVDLSTDMLAVSRQLNPECEHQAGDMRTIALGRSFDAVLVHDAVDYMTAEDDLRQVIATAFAHCRPGGLALFVPDHMAETFEAGDGGGGGREPGGRQASFTERTWDPDPGDTWVQADYEFWLRDADGTTRVVRESHRLAAFRRAQWHELLTEAGFTVTEPGPGPRGPGTRRPRNLFVARRPAA